MQSYVSCQTGLTELKEAVGCKHEFHTCTDIHPACSYVLETCLQGTDVSFISQLFFKSWFILNVQGHWVAIMSQVVAYRYLTKKLLY